MIGVFLLLVCGIDLSTVLEYPVEFIGKDSMDRDDSPSLLKLNWKGNQLTAELLPITVAIT